MPAVPGLCPSQVIGPLERCAGHGQPVVVPPERDLFVGVVAVGTLGDRGALTQPNVVPKLLGIGPDETGMTWWPLAVAISNPRLLCQMRCSRAGAGSKK